MSKKDKRVILICQCLVNPYCRVHVLGQNFPLTHEIMSYLTEHRVGLVEYPCPEMTAMGLQRNPQGRQQYDNTFFRQHCRELLSIPLLMVREFIKNGFRLTCFIGLENSPTCAVRWGRHKTNRYNTESPEVAEDASLSDPVVMGVMAEILNEELGKEGIKVPFLEFPAKSDPGSDRRKAFWKDLHRAVEPLADYGDDEQRVKEGESI